MSFSPEELDYLRSQRIARIATVDPGGQPDVVPVGYDYDGDHLYVGGMAPERTRKYRNVRAGNDRVALVIDDLVTTEPWVPRFLRVYGTATLVERRGQFGTARYLRITPVTSWSFNLAGRPFIDERSGVVTRTEHQARPDAL